MGDLRAWSPERNGAVLEEKNKTETISEECWQRAEGVTEEIIAHVQPTVVSEDRRKAVIDYVQRLIRTSVGCEVFPFGSVPLKTYLPDGDIDLTAFGGINMEEALANDVCSVLEREDQNKNAEFVVKDVQLIRAEVKIVKCLVQNIVVDISFNQLGGLCTLCFLEQVDGMIGKDHLFKRSIILIKAWCYYESRILGAHHGLIATYALETLVLYIFHLFHSSLNGPLAVLYKFLDYFSKFDWDNYCISLNGPVHISSLPEVVVEVPENGGCDLLLSNDFLKECSETFSVPPRAFESNSRPFAAKHLNIVDPLKENNNLGRSVSKGNFFRIRSAFNYGARKLASILSQPEKGITDELSKFFSNTLDRHGSGRRPDVQDCAPVDAQRGSSAVVLLASSESNQEDHAISDPELSDTIGITGEQRIANEQPLHGSNIKIGRKKSFSRTTNEQKQSANWPSVSANRLSGDAKDLATSRMQGLSVANDALKSSAPNDASISPMRRAHHVPHLYFPCSVMENGEVGTGNSEGKHQDSSGLVEKRESSGFLRIPAEDTLSAVSSCKNDKQMVSNHEVPSPVKSNRPLLFSSKAEDLNPRPSSNRSRSSETLNIPSDLSGDHMNHLNSLHYGRWWFEYALSASVPSLSTPLFNQFPGKNSWDVVRRSMQFRQNVVSQMNANGIVQRPVFYPMAPPFLPGAAFGMKEMQKPRGTGTYFPNTNHYRDRTFTSRGRNQGAARSPRCNGQITTSQETILSERNHHERDQSQAEFHIHLGVGRSGSSSDLHHSGSPETKHSSNINGSMHLAERVVEFGSTGDLQSGTSSTQGRQTDPGLEVVDNCSGCQAMPRTYQLKDVDDFPPLSDSSRKGLSICTVKKLEKSEH